MAKRVVFEEKKSKGKATVFNVGVVSEGSPRVEMSQWFYGVKSKPKAIEYAKWLEKILAIEASAKGGA